MIDKWVLRGNNELMTTVLDMPDRSSARGRVAAEVRAEAARAGVSQNRLAQLTGISQSSLNRKMKALRPFDIDELESIANVLGVEVESFFGGTRKDPHPDGPDGGLTSRLRESNSRPFHYLSDGSAEIVSLFPATPGYDELGIPA